MVIFLASSVASEPVVAGSTAYPRGTFIVRLQRNPAEVHERIAALAPSRIARLGVIGTRARAIVALAREITGGRLALHPGAEVKTTLEHLRGISGIGEWTAQYIAMRALRWPDAFPHSDFGVLKAMNETNPRRVLQRAEAWRPWRAYAVMHLWKSLETSKP